MSDETERRTGGALWLAVLAVAAAGGIGAWFLLSNRDASTVDEGGFDVSAAPRPRTAAPAGAPVAVPVAMPSSLGMVKGGAEALNAAEGSAPPVSPAPAGQASEPSAPAAPVTREQALANFIAQARKHEGDIARYAMELTAKSPMIRQYGQDWMSRPDLKKLNDGYFRDHDPVKFAFGLMRAPSFPAILAKYAGAPEMQAAVVQGMTKAAPAELLQAGLDAARLDPQLKTLVSGVARTLGLPPGMTAVLASADPSAADKAKAAGELKNAPAGGR